MHVLTDVFFSFLGSMLVVGFPPFAVPASFIKCILLFITNCLWMNEINIIIERRRQLLPVHFVVLFVQEQKCDYFKKFKWQCVQTSHVPVCAKKYCESGVSFQNSNNCIFYHYFCLPFKLNGPPEQQRSRFRLTHQMALQCICRTHSIRSAQLDASLFFPTRK